MSVQDLQRMFDELEASPQEITQLDYTEDSVRSYGSPVDVKTTNVTGSGQTELVAAPAAGFRLVVRYLGYSLNGATATLCSVRQAGGTDKYSQRLQAQGQAWARGFHLTEWQLPEATALQATLSIASDVYITVETETRAV